MNLAQRGVRKRSWYSTVSLLTSPASSLSLSLFLRCASVEGKLNCLTGYVVLMLSIALPWSHCRCFLFFFFFFFDYVTSLTSCFSLPTCLWKNISTFSSHFRFILFVSCFILLHYSVIIHDFVVNYMLWWCLSCIFVAVLMTTSVWCHIYLFEFYVKLASGYNICSLIFTATFYRHSKGHWLLAFVTRPFVTS